MSILAWLSVVLLPTIVIPTTLTFTLSSKPKEIVDGLDKLGIVNRKEKKEMTMLAPTRVVTGTSGSGSPPPAKPAAARPVPAKPPTTPQAPPTPKEPAPTTPKEPAPTTPKQPSDDDQGDSAQSSEVGQTGGDGQEQVGEPGVETEGPKISTEDIAMDSILRITSLSEVVMSQKGNLLNSVDLSLSLERLEKIINGLQSSATKAAQSPSDT